MGKLAIRGHANRGKEIIEILEMLGGKNIYKLDGKKDLWYILSNSTIEYATYSFQEKCYNIDEFEARFPYKVGDKVNFSDSNTPFTISRMWWDSNASELICTLEEQDIDVPSVDLQPYKGETMEEPKELLIGFTKDRDGNWVLNVHKDYEIKEVDGKFILLKKKPQYPKTYEECYSVLEYEPDEDVVSCYSGKLIESFVKLLICRDAYWKIAGEQMGLGKSWEPDFDNENEYKYGLFRLRNIIYKDATCINPTLLIFPTSEMRDVFYENFKDLIEQCKELL